MQQEFLRWQNKTEGIQNLNQKKKHIVKKKRNPNQRQKKIKMISKISSVICLSAFVILLTSNGAGAAEKEIPITKFSQNVGGPTMTFLYW